MSIQLQKVESEKENYEKIVNSVQNLLNDYFNAKIQDIPETLRVILSEGDPLLKQKNHKLKQIIRGQINFIQNFAETGKFDSISLDQSRKTKAKTIKNAALEEIERCRSFLVDNKLMAPDEFNEAEVSNEKHLSFQIAINDILRKECEKRKHYKELLDKLNDSLDIEEGDDVSEVIQNRMELNQNFLSTAIDIMKLDQDTDPDAVYQEIIVYLKQLSSLHEVCDGKLRKVIRFEGNAAEIPNATIDYIKKLKKEKSKEISSIKNGTSDLRNELKSYRTGKRARIERERKFGFKE